MNLIDHLARAAYHAVFKDVLVCTRDRGTEPAPGFDDASDSQRRNFTKCARAILEALGRDDTLVGAIRRFTYDAPDGGPNGPTERLLAHLDDLIRVVCAGDGSPDALRALATTWSQYLRQSADDAQALREAAERVLLGADVKGAPNDHVSRSLRLGEELFRFESKQHWIDTARTLYLTSGIGFDQTLAIDESGRVALMGADFSLAEREGTYPIRVYAVHPELRRSAEVAERGRARAAELDELELALSVHVDTSHREILDQD